MTTSVVSAAEDGDYDLEPLREWGDFTLYRGSERRSHMPMLAVAITAERPSTRSLGRLEHEFSLAGGTRPGVGRSAVDTDSSSGARAPGS